MNIKGLDRYLTQEPPDDFTPWVEEVVEQLFKLNEEWDVDSNFLDSKEGDALLEKFYLENKSPKETAELIYKLHPDK